jgi:hypothetical protein
MIFNLLKGKRDESAETGTAHQRDYGNDRAIAPIPAGFA